MAERSSAFTIVALLLLSVWLPVWNVNASTGFSTSVSFQGSFSGDVTDGGNVFTSANPTFSLTVSNTSNLTVINTEYELSNATSTQQFNYTTNVTIQSNYTSIYDLKYRTNTTYGLESWKTLRISIDADSPTVNLVSGNTSERRYTQNQSVLLVSQYHPVEFQCSDSISGVQSFSGLIGNETLNSSSNRLTITKQDLGNYSNQSQQVNATLTCLDNVGNSKSSMISLILDDEVPILTVTESGHRSGNCVSDTWKLLTSSTDNHSSVVVESWNQSAWVISPSSISPQSNTGNSSIILRATDSSGFSSLNQSWNISVDTTPPSLSTTLNSTSLSFIAYDNCSSPYVQVQWETISGQTSGWTTYQNSSLTIPIAFNGSVVRAKIKAFDTFNNQNQVTTGWINTNGSIPTSIVVLQNPHLGNVSNSSVSFRITPVGYLANTSYSLSVNGQLDLSGYTTSQYLLNRSLSHNDQFTLSLNTTNGFGGSSLQIFNYSVDNSNSHSLAITLSGQSLNTTSLLLGPTGRLTPAAASDDNTGVGGSYASCTWDGTTWFQSTAGFKLRPVHHI